MQVGNRGADLARASDGAFAVRHGDKMPAGIWLVEPFGVRETSAALSRSSAARVGAFSQVNPARKNRPGPICLPLPVKDARARHECFSPSSCLHATLPAGSGVFRSLAFSHAWERVWAELRGTKRPEGCSPAAPAAAARCLLQQRRGDLQPGGVPGSCRGSLPVGPPSSHLCECW